MLPGKTSPALYGLDETNSSRRGKDLWGKNQFNSTFPVSLCLYMRDHSIKPVSVIARGDKIQTQMSFSMANVIGTKIQAPVFLFEEAFEPYSKLSRNQVDKIDLVVEANGEHLKPLEIKLTVVPDLGTSKKDETEWAPELVMRPVTSAYAMMGVASSISKNGKKYEALKILRSVYNNLDGWGNSTEIKTKANALCKALDKFLNLAEKFQNPFLIQPIWRTKGQTLILTDKCFDVFVWSDVAVMRLPLDQYQKGNTNGEHGIRYIREIARHVRATYDLLSQGDYDYQSIYKGMALNVQTDKAFAIAGIRSRRYLNHERLKEPILHRDILGKIVLNDGENKLRPERRFDAAVQAYYAHLNLGN